MIALLKSIVLQLRLSVLIMFYLGLGCGTKRQYQNLKKPQKYSEDKFY